MSTSTQPQRHFPTPLHQLLNTLLRNSNHDNTPLLSPEFAKTQPFVTASLNRVLLNLASLLNPQGDEGSRELVRSSVQELDQLEAYVFDRLNTGHWRSVDGGWREVYSVVCLLKLPLLILENDHHNTPESLIQTCDMGLLMGAPIHDNVLGRIAEELCSDLRARNTRNSPPPPKKRTARNPAALRNRSRNEFQLQQLTRPSLEHFSNLMNTSTPAKLLGIVEHWRALRRWSVAYIRETVGPRSVPVELGPRYTAPDWTQKIMTISAFIDNFIMSPSPATPTAYIAQHNLFTQLPCLSADISPPDYTLLSPNPPEINAWFGPANTISPTHHDPNHNILVQVFGTKAIRLFPPSESANLRPYPAGSLLFNTSSLDVEAEGLFSEAPGMSEAVHCDVVLGAGEALFIPRGWWHYVKSVGGGGEADASFSVSFWFE